MMFTHPGPAAPLLISCLVQQYDLVAAEIQQLPIGNDAQAAVYRVETGDGSSFFLKARIGPPFEPGLAIPRALLDRGVTSVIAPMRARDGALWVNIADTSLWNITLFPFVSGQSAKFADMTADQWRSFGTALRRVHSSHLGDDLAHRLRVDDFSLPAAALVRELLAEIEHIPNDNSVAGTFAAFWRDHAERIRALLARADELGRELRSRAFDRVLCHGDIHLTNVLVGDDGRVWMVDWDASLIAPRERDLLFVVGSRIGRRPTLQEEDWFFDGYGPVDIDRTALIFYRYERRIEDLGEVGVRVFRDPDRDDVIRAAEASAIQAFFAPDSDFDVIEDVARWQWPAAIHMEDR